MDGQKAGYNFGMAKLITAVERIAKANQLIVKAREIPAPENAGWEYFSYVAQVKDTLKQAFELVKLIQFSPSTPVEVKAEARALIDSLTSVQEEILKGKKGKEA